jgi:hypothetical protein
MKKIEGWLGNDKEIEERRKKMMSKIYGTSLED